MKWLATLAFLVVLSLCVAAHADGIRVFSINATLQSGSVAGTVTLDATNGVFVDAAITGMYQGSAFSFSGAPILYDAGYGYTRIHYGSTALAFGTDLPTAVLVDYSGGALCSINSLCAGSISSGVGTGTSTLLDAVLAGSLVQVNTVVTPEPSTLALLSTGLCSMAGAARRRQRLNGTATKRGACQL